MLKYLLTALIALSVIPATAQYNPEKVNKKAVQSYNHAMEKAMDGDLKAALNLLLRAVDTDKNYLDAYLSIAGIYGEFKDYQNSVTNYEIARKIDPEYFREFNLPYSINLAGLGRFHDALNAVEEYLGKKGLNPTSIRAGEYRKITYLFAIEQEKKLAALDYRFEPKNLGDEVNSEFSEYFPSLTVDGKKLVFTRRVNNTNEDFFESSAESGTWSIAKSLEGNINTNFNEGAQNISQDGQMLVFTGCNFENGYGSCDIYFSLMMKTGWSEPQNIGREINTEFWESQPCLSPDKRELYFASNRPGGYGGSDIYVSRRLANGKWGPPQNLGPTINTPGDESCPFIHADNLTLFFMSNGHPGYGGDDLFLSRRQDNNQWGTPVNLGYPINTIENEGSLFITSDGNTAYYASDRHDSRGGLDLYTFELREDIKPVPTRWVKGKVYDAKTGAGLPSGLELTDLRLNRVNSKVQTDEEGNYLITIPTGIDFAFNVNRKGYLFHSETFRLTNVSHDSAFIIDIPLQPLESNANIVLKNIFFETNRFDLKPESTVELDKLVALLQENPDLRVQISGHTDNSGNPASNKTLSENRAKAVVDYLISKGIAAARLEAKGYGDTLPVADNNTEEGKAQNRRTEMTVL
jgi:outer membrane protein OmpA-like peptidoglycan-associated protein